MIRSRFDLQQEYIVLSEQAVHALLTGSEYSLQQLLDGAKRVKFDKETTIVTKLHGTILQYSILSKGVGAIQSEYNTVYAEDALVRCEDVNVFSSEAEIAELIDVGVTGEALREYMMSKNDNRGPCIEDSVLKIGTSQRGNDGSISIVAGYELVQTAFNSHVSYRTICMSSEAWEQFGERWNKTDYRFEIFKQFLLQKGGNKW